ncbi:hypothetical protein J421_3878 [Gemmatirosa kalamazoonensis]|uniref:Pyrrolo-quinoline quinone repeat-containing protein n=2 Tax=Gemmatirosa kalamazoonensis TaxID=861299 RepID=W0RM77_9BACT|nr:hypothetical protein J421_3878 [Gemmatirosa kalamazoonensis]
MIVLAALGCERPASPPPSAAPKQGSQRRFAVRAADTSWVRALDGADDAPTASSLAADESSLYVTDVGSKTVLAFDQRTGVPRWRTHGGDDSSAVREPHAVTSGRTGGIIVYDAARGTLLRVGPDGRVRRSTPAATAGDAQSICELPDSSVLVSIAASSRGLVRIAPNGTVLSVTPLPWPGLRASGDLLSAVLLAPTPRGCIAALSFGLGFAEFEGSAFRPAVRFVEPLALPRVVVTRTEHDGGVTVSQSLAEHVLGAIDVGATDAARLVAFDGRSADRAHVVDVYDSLGAYRYSIRTRTRVEALAATSRALFVLTHRDGRPTIVALRWSARDTTRVGAR